jgi:hypothetical protein
VARILENKFYLWKYYVNRLKEDILFLYLCKFMGYMNCCYLKLFIAHLFYFFKMITRAPSLNLQQPSSSQPAGLPHQHKLLDFQILLISLP